MFKSTVLFMLLMMLGHPLAAAQDDPPPAQSIPLCTAQYEGALSCQANRVCECGYANAEPARGLPARWRWNCSLMQPQCSLPGAEAGAEFGADYAPGGALGGYPVIIDHNSHGRAPDRSEDRPRDRDGNGRDRPN
ncbi:MULTISPECIES: hypothetical protein [unclassified Iodidimonas]|jgi:hypothetical protein|uniref:hypothetical protein n=1 Tax=unclassified Iodidimonas TaxID=2626145 RepID=UPI002482B837|nr:MULTISPECIES: hypothetical protein [unclassified Iodidimonas]